MDELINYVNNNQFTWEANTCMLQSHHPNYDADECEDEIYDD
jgi:hypothetical protein